VPAEVKETHTSTLVFVDDRVYKRKKPLDLGFSDFRTLEARRLACAEEVRLNRRLAPDVYVGTATVLGTDGDPCEVLVVMRRLPDDRRMSALVASGVDVRPALDEIASQLAALHANNPAVQDMERHATAPALGSLWADGCAVLGASPAVPGHLVERLREDGLGWLEAHPRLLSQRVSEHRVVDGHGDLLVDDVFVLDDGPRVLDCLEFDAGLRTVDGLHDACSLAMDLERIGVPELAARFLDTYRSIAADDAPRSLEHFFLAYRALVRAKVACLRAAQGDDASPAQALLLTALCRDHLDAATNRLVLVGGLPGSGKSTVAAGLAAERGFRHLSSDRVRTATNDATGGRYTDAARDAVYRSLLELARDALTQGEDVVLDATFGHRPWRQQARALGAALHAQVIEVVCTAPENVALERLRTRPAGDSEATPLVRLALAERWDPWPEATTVDCSHGGSGAVSAAVRVVGTAGR
jgi:aminoglycoside phosphotransferase family enzyme/predicted kinase